MPARTDLLAQAGIEGIQSGMIVGLGTGSAAARALDALAQRAREDSLEIRCIATSVRSEERARSLGLSVMPLQLVSRVDWLFDGADEVDPPLRLLKGRGGAMTREKIVARASAHRVYLVQESKVVDRLGSRHDLPIEIMHLAHAMLAPRLAALGLTGRIRRTESGQSFETDNGHMIIDVAIPPVVDVVDLARSLDSLAGVVGHGLFLDEADVVVVEDDDGNVRHLEREAI